jgi:hypothetical protein
MNLLLMPTLTLTEINVIGHSVATQLHSRSAAIEGAQRTAPRHAVRGLKSLRIFSSIQVKDVKNRIDRMQEHRNGSLPTHTGFR